MKKLIIITTGIALLTLTSCSKEESYDCEQIRKDFQAELEVVRRQSSNNQALRYLNEKYSKYPCW
jgi:hypothetical protein